ncbi:small subunit ribosomal protein S16, partial [Phenoliferia sp. Uapishka_3]
MVRLRLARDLLTRNSPTYRIVAIQTSLRTTARPLEVLGTYHPRPSLSAPQSTSPNGLLRGPEWGPPQAAAMTSREVPGEKKVEWNRKRVEWWLSQGAQPSKTVEKLLITAGVMKPRAAVLDGRRIRLGKEGASAGR